MEICFVVIQYILISSQYSSTPDKFTTTTTHHNHDIRRSTVP